MARRDVLKSFGERVRAIRNAKGMSQERLAELADLDRTYVGGVERGERNIALRNIHRVANALGVSVADLFSSGNSNG